MPYVSDRPSNLPGSQLAFLQKGMSLLPSLGILGLKIQLGVGVVCFLQAKCSVKT